MIVKWDIYTNILESTQARKPHMELREYLNMLLECNIQTDRQRKKSVTRIF